LIESLGQGEIEAISPAWQKEIDKRCLEIDQNEVELADAEMVLMELEASIS
jgi:hypothetical protein